jgi:hypothetical protein
MNKSIIDEIKENDPLKTEIISKSQIMENHEKLYVIQKGALFEVRTVSNRQTVETEGYWSMSHINYQFITSFQIRDYDELNLIVDMLVIQGR